jgi:hypothetical protein
MGGPECAPIHLQQFRGPYGEGTVTLATPALPRSPPADGAPTAPEDEIPGRRPSTAGRTSHGSLPRSPGRYVKHLLPHDGSTARLSVVEPGEALATPRSW